MEQDAIDRAVEAYYTNTFDEASRLTTRSAQGRLEFERTQDIVRRHTPAPARILDVGGATGIHAVALAEAGYEVVLIDPVESQVRAAAAHGTFEARVGDARSLELRDESFDAVLMAGPLYHLVDRADRLQALREAVRVCRPGGVVHAAAIPRFLAFSVAALDSAVVDSAPDALLSLLRDGTPPHTVGFPAGHFHTPEELEDEMVGAGLTSVHVVGLEGPAALALEIADDLDDEDYRAAGRLAATFQESPMLRNFSCHLLATGRVLG